MKKRNSLLMGLGILLLIAAGVATYMMTRPSVETAETLSSGTTYAKAKSMPITAACLDENKALTISAGDRTQVENMAMSHLYDVPAGTHVEIVVASYSKDHVTGSDYYPDTYGSYNFAMNKRANGDWQFTKFEHCR